MEKKRVDVKETRNLAKNKGREKKEGRKTTLSPSHACRKGSAAKMRVLRFQFGPLSSTTTTINDILHLLDDIFVSDVEHNSGGIERAETEDDCGYGGG